MLTKTSLNAIQALVYLALRDDKHPVAPGELAKQLGASTTYLSKVNTQLAKAGIVQAHRGTRGGVTLARRPEDITLRAVVEACQGQILGDYCAPHDDLEQVCAFHAAMHELQQAIINALDNWTLADLAETPLPSPELREQVNCLMARAAQDAK
ncbi:MAG: RrF2 family transcriptional regulator [Candidatus Hydrogenedentota bacterium]